VLAVALGGGALVAALGLLVLVLVLRSQTESPGPVAPNPQGARPHGTANPTPVPPRGQAPAAPAEASLPITAQRLGREYEADRNAADKKFKGKLLSVEGEVWLNNIAHPLFSIELQAATRDEDNVRLVVCSLRKDLEGKLSPDAVKVGQKATLRGRCAGLDQVERVVLTDCEPVAGAGPSAPPAAAGGGARPAWREFTSPEGRFSVLLPEEPLREQEGNAHKFSLAAAGGQIVYLVSGERLAEGALDGDPKAVLAQFGQGPGSQPGSKYTGRKDIALGKNPGVEYEEESNWDGRAMHTVGRAYVVGGNLYQLAVI
jgi:hypothetical protein